MTQTTGTTRRLPPVPALPMAERIRQARLVAQAQAGPLPAPVPPAWTITEQLAAREEGWCLLTPALTGRGYEPYPGFVDPEVFATAAEVLGFLRHSARQGNALARRALAVCREAPYG